MPAHPCHPERSDTPPGHARISAVEWQASGAFLSAPEILRRCTPQNDSSGVILSAACLPTPVILSEAKDPVRRMAICGSTTSHARDPPLLCLPAAAHAVSNKKHAARAKAQTRKGAIDAFQRASVKKSNFLFGNLLTFRENYDILYKRLYGRDAMIPEIAACAGNFGGVCPTIGRLKICMSARKRHPIVRSL